MLKKEVLAQSRTRPNGWPDRRIAKCVRARAFSTLSKGFQNWNPLEREAYYGIHRYFHLSLAKQGFIGKSRPN
jgi:hypothetical protein